MPLQTPYGVIIGALQSADLVNPDTGQWPHYHVRLLANGTILDSAINLKSLTNIQIEYRRRTFLDDSLFSQVTTLPDGWHALAQTPGSGALDYVRHTGITGATGWILQNGNNLINELSSMLSGVQRLFIFGAQYHTLDGVHDVHMNQGDPDGSSFQPLDAIWQDGGLLFQYGAPQPRLDILQIKFETQSLYTDDNGHPLHLRLIPPIYEYIPRWRWPPGDPWSDVERQILVERGLFQLAAWAAVIPEVKGAAHDALAGELRNQLNERLGGASADQLHRSAAYLIKMGQAFRQLSRTAAV
jgi:hypothetical protein